MDFRAFRRTARRAFDEIPDEYREGVDALVVRRDALPHPTLPDVYTLGQCLTEDHPSDYSGPETVRSVIELYWGSFRALARLDPGFDWEGELWETLTHELRHHLESLARSEALEGVDYAADETFKRDEGLDFDPWYWQHGDDLGGGVYRVEDGYYLEQVWASDAFQAVAHVEFTWNGCAYRFPRPESLGDLHFVRVEGVDKAPRSLEVVLVRRRSWWEDMRRLLGARRPEVHESAAIAEPVPPEG